MEKRIKTSIVGSYPKPRYMFRGTGRSLLDSVGMSFYELETRLGAEEFKKRLDRATLMALKDQNKAGIDYVSDGEERRDHYIMYVLRRLEGIDFQNLKEKKIRGGRYTRNVPTVVAKIRYKKPILIGIFQKSVYKFE